MFEGYIITKKKIHKYNKRPLCCLYGTGEFSLNGAFRFSQYETNCNTFFGKFKPLDDGEILYRIKTEGRPEKEIKTYTPVITSSKNVLMTKLKSDSNIEFCPKCFPNGIEDIEEQK